MHSTSVEKAGEADDTTAECWCNLDNNSTSKVYISLYMLKTINQNLTSIKLQNIHEQNLFTLNWIINSGTKYFHTFIFPLILKTTMLTNKMNSLKRNRWEISMLRDNWTCSKPVLWTRIGKNNQISSLRLLRGETVPFKISIPAGIGTKCMIS